MQFNFSGKTAIVTGGMRGIGRSIANGLVKGGAEVHVFDLNVPEGPCDGLTMHNVNVVDAKAVNDAVAGMPRSADLLVNNAGITRDRSLVKMSDDEWRSVLDVNLTGAFNCLRAVAPGMRDKGYGRIVNISSINGLRGKFGQANYAASKAGLIGLAKTAARELGAKGITVNVVAPGMVMTEMALALDEQFRAKAQQEAVLPILPDCEDITAAVLFLLSDEARCITGQVLQVDSGQRL
jgi:3-oxoacyl-[acyl-carrier protein] reductase